MGESDSESKGGEISYSIAHARPGDVRSIVRLINSESRRSGAVLKVDGVEVKDWIGRGVSLVARTADGAIIGHLSAHQWPQSMWVELRSSVVHPEYRGNGISSAINSAMVKAIRKKFGTVTLVAFTNKAGTGKGILLASGFRDAEYGHLPRELFSVGPKYRGKKEYGYRIFVRDT